MSVRLLLAADRVPTPWRNGGGITHEIAAWPPGAPLEGFDWRVSMAEVREPGPFSTFPGVDRVLTILQGTLSLAIEGRPAVTLTAESLPFCFAGEASCVGAPLGGPVLDLNVMARRDRFSADVRRISIAELTVAAAASLLVALSAGQVMVGTSEWHLGLHDALLLRNEGDRALAVQGASAFISLLRR